jgi:hypothetical protein
MSFQARRIVCSASFVLPVAPDAAFAFFEPEGERAWAPGWSPRYLFPGDGRAEQGMVFTTGEGGDETLWLMTSHDIIRHRVEYVRVTPGSRIGLVGVACEPHGATATEVTVRYTLTALGEAGNRQLDEFAAGYDAYIDSWRDGIEKALRG